MLSSYFNNKVLKENLKHVLYSTEFFRKRTDSLGNLITAMEMHAYTRCCVNFQEVQGLEASCGFPG